MQILDGKNQKLDISILFFLIFIMILGGYVRLGQVVNLDFPLNDGGMFYQMTVDLKANHYVLPETTTYNQLDIPFVYPPLGFYLLGITSDLFQVNLLDLVRVLPAAISVLTIPAFYWLARILVDDKAHVSMAVFTFAFMPSAYKWLIMGGGITRSLGFLFSLLTLQQAVILYTKNTKVSIILTSIFGSLTILSHPEAAVHTVIGVFVVFLFFGRSRKGLFYSFIVGLGVLFFSFPWWVSVIIHHGLRSILAASGTVGNNFSVVLRFLIFDFTEEIWLSILGVFSLIGVFITISRKNFFFLVWLIFTYSLVPRSGPLYLSPIQAIMSGIAIAAFFELLNKNRNISSDTLDKTKNWAEYLLSGCTSKLALIYLIVISLFSASLFTFSLGNEMSITDADVKAFEWIHDNTPTESVFGLITGKGSMVDPVSEWFPVFTQRISHTTVQGHEWLPDSDFEELLESNNELVECFKQDIKCLNEWELSNNFQFDYLYIRKYPTGIDSEYGSPLKLEVSLIESGEYQVLYEAPEVSILKLR